jgi:hypothetical protein
MFKLKKKNITLIVFYLTLEKYLHKLNLKLYFQSRLQYTNIYTTHMLNSIFRLQVFY